MMANTLLCPIQVWVNDIELLDTLMILTENPTSKRHAIGAEDTEGQEIIIPLSLQGVTLYFLACKPTPDEFNSCPQIDQVPT